MTQVMEGTTTDSALAPQRLTRVLRESGALLAGKVIAAETVRRFETGPSTVTRLALRYSADALGEKPERLFMKAPKPHKFYLGRNEAVFYRNAAGLPHLVSCYEAHCDPDAQETHVLLADKSATHQAGRGAALSLEQAEAALDALAALQAHWWDHSDLGHKVGKAPMDGFCAKYDDTHASNRRRYGQLLDLHGAAVGTETRAIYEKALDKGPDALLARAAQGDLTLGHHDLHPGNILFPEDPRGPVYLIDWQNDWSWFGVKDLAFFLVFAWEPARCRQAEKGLLERYRRRLEEAGVKGYTQEKAWRDYRLAAIELLFRPLGNRQAPDVLQNVERCVQAFKSLGCRELLG